MSVLNMKEYFGPEGLLAQKIPHFEFRTCQLEMAEEVARCLRDQQVLFAEAGTGTGKTWAYLIPAILTGKRVVISTGTKTLQDQILDHDIPLLRRLLFPYLRAVCLKGRKNYLCRSRLRDFSYQPTLYNREEAKLFGRFQTWAAQTVTGDRAEIDWLPDHFQTWNEVSCTSDQCLGQQCAELPRCFLNQLRQEAMRAQILVVNHHLFFADLALRRKGAGGIIPEPEAIVFDEAHQLEEIIGLYFGLELSNLKITELARDLHRECAKQAAGLNNHRQIENIRQQLEVLARRLHRCFAAAGTVTGRHLLQPPPADAEFGEVCLELSHALQRLSALLGASPEEQPALEALSRRSLELDRTVREFVEQRDASLVYWYETAAHGVFLHGTPVEVASVLRETLFAETHTVILTSATLSVAGSFAYLRETLGAPESSREMLVASPFAYQEQTLLYIPDKFPAPQEPDFCREMMLEAVKILAKTQGRALFLFTSYRNLNQVYQLLHKRLPYPILIQGEKPKRALLAEFKARVDSVLLATSSFWQGIDVPGEALSCLLIDKLPFEPPDDPVTAARMERVARQGKSAFLHYQVPRAIIHLKQGVGRLIRSSRDRGIIVIFDVRLMTKGYGRLFLNSLPPCQTVHRLEAIDRFLAAPEAVKDQCGLT